ncbi:MAG: MFS transporter [Chthoniobacter sp.]|nr:MFS transporter [Chthoniobacter sp.]
MGDENPAALPENPTGGPPRVPASASGWRKTFAAFRHRNYRLFFVGQLISLIGNWVNSTAEGWLVYQLTGSTALLGVVAAASTGPMLVLSTWGGWIADRHPKRTVLVITQIVSMVLSLVLAFLVWSGRVQPWQIVVMAALGGVVMAFDMPARQSFVIEITSREDLKNAISLNSSMVNGARIIGPSLAGVFMAWYGVAFCYLADGLSFIAVIVGLLAMRLPKHVRKTHAGSGLDHALGGFRYVWNNPRALTILSLFTVVGIFGWSYSVLMPAFARDVLGLGEKGYSALLAASGGGALCGALSVTAVSDRYAPRKLVLGGVWIFSIMLTLFAINRNYYVALPLLAGAGFGLMLFLSTSNSALQTSVPDEMRGRVMGVWALIFGGMMPFGSLEAGVLARVVGVPVTMIIGAIVCAIAAAVTLVIIQRRERDSAKSKT